MNNKEHQENKKRRIFHFAHHIRLKAISIILLIAILVLCQIPFTFAMESSHLNWPGQSGDNKYIATNGFVHFKGIDEGFKYSLPTYFCVEIKLQTEPESYYYEPEYFTRVKNIDGTFYDSGIKFGEDTLEKRCRIEPIHDGSVDYSAMQYWRFYDAYSDNSAVFPVLMFVEDPVNDEKNINKLQAYTQRAEKLVSVMKSFNKLYDTLNAAQKASAVKVGAYHPGDINLLCKVANSIQTNFGITTGYFDTHNYWVEGDGWLDATVEDIIRHWTEYIPYGSNTPVITSDDTISQNELNQLDRLLDIIGPYWINYIENHRIANLQISAFELNGSRGIIDANDKKITIRLPESTDWNNLPVPAISLSGEGIISKYMGSFESGEVLYQLTPADLATGTYYNGNDTTGFGFGVNLSSIWKVVVENGTPYNQVMSFSITTEDGKKREAHITEGTDGEKGLISLNLPNGTDLGNLIPEVDYAGEGYYLTVNGERTEPGTPIDFTKIIELVVFNTTYDIETSYKVELTAGRSSENSILSYKIGDAIGTIDGDTISITIPYATDLSSAEPVIELSEFAQLTSVPDSLSIGNNVYEVTAEDGTLRTYTVIISQAAASKEKNILSFKYGGYEGVINNSQSSVTITLPKGVPTTFAPEIEVSAFATITPASGEVQDFSSPVKYKVTAQNGSSKTYTVTVEVQDGPAPNAYQSSLRDIVDKIISRYRTSASDDWEWMDLGFYQNLEANVEDGFSVANTIGTLDSTTNVAMTNIARKLMTLSARGFNCSKLSQYNGGKPFIDAKGNEVDNLVKVMYSFSGGYTINGPIFALLALDMGNYTVPDDAVWTREKLLDVILSYSGDEFGIDMVGSIMYAIAPYQDDPVYGELVRDRLNNCLNKVLSSMNEDYSFGAWGATNSESAAWVMMGLCSMGIDWNVDPRFSDGQGHSALQHWMDNFANVQEGYFHHTTSVRNNYMATYEGCYACMWYLGFLNHGGQGNPYYFYYHRFDFSQNLSADASILSFELEGKQGVIEEGEENTIAVTLPKGTPLENMQPAIVLSDGAKLIGPSLPTTFIEGEKKAFTVCAEDGKTFKTYFVTVTYDDVAASGAELDTDSIHLKNSAQNEETILSKAITVADDGATEVLITVNPGVDTSHMYISADVSYAAKCNPKLDDKTQMDLSDWLAVNVTSEDGKNSNTYRIKVVAKAKAEITSFRVQAGETWYSGDIDNTANTIVVRDVDDSNLTSTELVTDIDFTGRTCQPTSGLAMDFAGAVTYTLGGDAELAGRSYTVKVLNKSGKFISAQSSGEDPSGGSSLSQQLWDAVMEESDVVDHQTSYDGWINLDGNWYYVEDGAIAYDYTGVKNNENGWWYIENGKVDFTYKGFASNEHGWWYLEGGQVKFNKNDIIQGKAHYAAGAAGEDGWWLVRKSQVVKETTVAQNAYGWWRVEDGKVNFDYEGVAQNEHGWWYIDNGKVDFTYKGFASNEHGWWYLEGGQVKFNKNDIIQGKAHYAAGAAGEDGWWLVRKSQVVKETTVAQNAYGWWYCKDGKVDFNCNSVEQNEYGWWKIENGKVNFNFTGLASNQYGTWYLKNGKVDFSFNGSYNGKRVTNGKVQE